MNAREHRSMADDVDEFIEGYRKQLGHVDDFIQMVVNAHLDIETHLDDFLAELVFHTSALENARLSFPQKVHVARAFVELGQDRIQWQIMLTLNSIRNKIVHRKMREMLGIDTSGIRKMIVEFNPQRRERVERLNGHDVIVYAAAISTGYLVVLQEQLMRLQGKEIDWLK